MFSGLSELVIEDVEDAGEVICVRARTRDRAVACPGCGAETARVHEYPERTAADVPADGRRVVVKVRVRRMRCPVLDCKVQTFRKQVSGVLERYQRRISRLTAQVSAVARELAGRASARLLPALGIGVSRHTALRTLLAIRLPGLAVPRVLGIDDFALRRGLVYATILIDGETGRRVDVLEGRTADVVEEWLREHPGADRPHIAPRKATQTLLTRPDSLPDDQRETAGRLSGACPEMAALSSLIGNSPPCSTLTPPTRGSSFSGSGRPALPTSRTCTRSPAASNSTSAPPPPRSRSRTTTAAPKASTTKPK